MAPSGIVAWLGGIHDVVNCALAFLWPLAWLISLGGFHPLLSLCLSALLQGGAFFCITRSRTLTARGKATICITWGMFFALALRLALAYAAWQSVMPAQQ